MADHRGDVSEFRQPPSGGVTYSGWVRFEASCKCGWSAEAATWARCADKLLAHQEKAEVEEAG
jgi:hypothetical protein